MDFLQQFQQAFAAHRQGRLAEAIAGYEAVLKVRPEHADAWHFSGLVLHQLGRSGEGLPRIEQALRLMPQNPDIWINRAQLLSALGQFEAALHSLDEGLQRAPRNVQAWSNRASLLLQAGRAEAALASAEKARNLAPQAIAPRMNLVLARRALGDIDGALAELAQLPGEPDPQRLGLAADLEALRGNLASARRLLEQALKLAPENAGLHYQIALVHERAGDNELAAHGYDEVLKRIPDHGPALSARLFLAKRLVHWDVLADLQQRFRDGLARELPHLTPFSFLTDPGSRAEHRRCAELWSRRYQGLARLPARPLNPGKLRIGYLSSDYCQHATAILIGGLFEHHERGGFEIFAYSTGRDDGSAMRRRLMDSADHFIDARTLSPQHLAARIAADGIDILVDLKGHTELAPMAAFAMRPAPIQVTWLGYPGTLGADFADYLIGDPVVTPLVHAPDYQEALVLLPDTYQINDRERPIADPPPRADLGLPDNALVFCSFNATGKLNPAVFDAWARILGAVSDSVLWLLVRRGEDAVKLRLRAALEQRGIAGERVVFADFRANADYLGLYRHADLFLDTWPYNAHTTASDALWGGCPVLTWQGETFPGRVAASLLRACGLAELIRDDVEDYVATAVRLASERTKLADYRRYLETKGRQSPLFDTGKTVRALECAYRRMAEDYRAGIRQPFQVE